MSRRDNTCGVRHTARRTAAACAAFGFLLSGLGASAGKLDDVRGATSGDDDDDDDDDNGGGDNGGGDGNEGGGDSLAGAVTEAFADALFDAAAARSQNTRFRRYPYAGGSNGWIVDLEDRGAFVQLAPKDDSIVELSTAVAPEPESLAQVSLRLSLDYAYDWDVVHRPSLAVALDTSAGVGVRADLTTYVETSEGDAPDTLEIGTANFLLRLGDSPSVASYIGVGWRYSIDGGTWHNGVNGVFALDVFPVKPLVVSAIAEGGNLGEAGYFHLRGTLGAFVRRFELFAGYDAVIIKGGGDAVVFHGPVAGIRAWF